MNMKIKTYKYVDSYSKDFFFKVYKNDYFNITYALRYFTKTNPEQAKKAAEIVISLSDKMKEYNELITAAYRALSLFKSDETEKIMIDYLVNHKSSDAAWDICADYFEQQTADE